MQIWMNITHGVKGINWFHYFIQTPNENFAVMSEFITQIADLTEMVLGPAPESKSISDDANEWGNRVDTMVREYNGKLWLIAVRITEQNETTNNTVTFRLNGASGTQASLYGSSAEAIAISGGQFSDTFAPCEVKIYMIQ